MQLQLIAVLKHSQSFMTITAMQQNALWLIDKMASMLKSQNYKGTKIK